MSQGDVGVILGDFLDDIHNLDDINNKAKLNRMTFHLVQRHVYGAARTRLDKKMAEFMQDLTLINEIDSDQSDCLEFSAHLAWRALNEADEESAEQHANELDNARAQVQADFEANKGRAMAQILSKVRVDGGPPRGGCWGGWGCSD